MTSTGVPAPLRWAVRLLGAQAVGTGAVALWTGVGLVGSTPADRADAAALTTFLALTAIALGGLAAALRRRRPRARAPAIVLQLLGVMFGYMLTVGGFAWVGVPLAVLAVVVATLLLTPGTHAALTDAPEGESATGQRREASAAGRRPGTSAADRRPGTSLAGRRRGNQDAS